MERIVPSPGIIADNFYIPEGTIVSIPYYVAHRDRNVFGEDAHSFRPERWLEAEPSALQQMDQSFLAVSVLSNLRDPPTYRCVVWQGQSRMSWPRIGHARAPHVLVWGVAEVRH